MGLNAALVACGIVPHDLQTNETSVIVGLVGASDAELFMNIIANMTDPSNPEQARWHNYSSGSHNAFAMKDDPNFSYSSLNVTHRLIDQNIPIATNPEDFPADELAKYKPPYCKFVIESAFTIPNDMVDEIIKRLVAHSTLSNDTKPEYPTFKTLSVKESNDFAERMKNRGAVEDVYE